MSRILLLMIVLSAGIPAGPVWAQLAEIKPFDTATNSNAAADRIYADAVKEHILNNDKEAEALFLRFLEASPDNAAAYFELARINAKGNNLEKARQYIRKSISLDSNNKWYQEFYGNLLASQNNYEPAAEIFSRLGKKYTPKEDYLLKASLLYQRAKKPDLAVAQLEALISVRGASEELLLQINQIYQKEKRVDKSAATLKRLIEANPKEGRYYALLAEMYDNNGQQEKSREIYEEGERKFPSDVSLQLGLASYYKRHNDPKKYTEYVNKAVRNTNLDEQTQLTLLVSYLQESEKDTSARANGLMLAEELSRQHPANAVIMGLYGDLLSMANRKDEAIAAYRRSLARDSSSINVWQQLLFHYTDKSAADTLIQLSKEALGLFPSQAILYYLNGIGYVNKGEYHKATKSILTAIDYQPEENKALLSEMYASLGDAYNSAKNYPAADKSFDKALELNETNATVLNNYAYYLSVRKTRLDDAERFSRRSLELRPGEATFLDTYGWIFYQQGKYEKAREQLQKAITQSGDDTDATLLEHMGDIYFKLNDIEHAVLYWQKAKQKDPTNEELEFKIRNKKLRD